MTDSASMRALRAGIALCLSGLVAACGGGGDGESAGTTATTPAPVQVTTPAPATSDPRHCGSRGHARVRTGPPPLPWM